jgi:hypothetical protein
MVIRHCSSPFSNCCSIYCSWSYVPYKFWDRTACEILEAHTPPANGLGAGHKGLYDTINNSLHFQLGLALASVGTITSLVA